MYTKIIVFIYEKIKILGQTYAYGNGGNVSDRLYHEAHATDETMSFIKTWGCDI